MRAIVSCDVLAVGLDDTDGRITIGTMAELEKNLVNETL